MVISRPSSSSTIRTLPLSDRARVCLLYGQSGTWKTTQIYFAAKWFWQKFRKRTRVISAEDWGPLMPAIRAGFVDPLNFASTDVPLTVLRKLGKGYWPKIAPDGQLRMLPTTAAEWAGIGLIAAEGGTSISSVLMQHLRATKRTIGQEAVTPFTEGDEEFSNSSKAHYGFIQNEMESFIKALGALPVDRVILTAHEVQAEDDDTKDPIRGPGFAGKAISTKAPAWVGECLHAESYTIKSSYKDTETGTDIPILKPMVRVFFVRHPDPKFPNITYPAKPRVPVEKIPQLMKRWPGGFFSPGLESGLDDYFELDFQLNQEMEQELKLIHEVQSQSQSQPNPSQSQAGEVETPAVGEGQLTDQLTKTTD